MSFIGLELAEAAGPPVVVEGEETEGEEDEEERRPGQHQMDIRKDKWSIEMHHKRMMLLFPSPLTLYLHDSAGAMT